MRTVEGAGEEGHGRVDRRRGGTRRQGPGQDGREPGDVERAGDARREDVSEARVEPGEGAVQLGRGLEGRRRRAVGEEQARVRPRLGEVAGAGEGAAVDRAGEPAFGADGVVGELRPLDQRALGDGAVRGSVGLDGGAQREHLVGAEHNADGPRRAAEARAAEVLGVRGLVDERREGLAVGAIVGDLRVVVMSTVRIDRLGGHVLDG